MLSYLLVLFLPVTIISYFIYFQFINQFEQEIMQSAARVLEQTRDITDNNLESFANISSNLSSNPHISYLLSHDNVEKVSIYPYLSNAIKELNKYKNANSSIDNIFIFFKDADMVLSDTSRYYLESFNKYVLSWQEMSTDEFKRILYNTHTQTILPSQTAIFNNLTRRIISYIQPIPMKDPFPKALLMITVDESSIKRSIETSLSQYEGYACVLDANNKIIMGNKSGNFLFDDGKRDALLSGLKDQEADSCYITKYGFVVSSVKSQENNWKYISIIPSYTILDKVSDIQNRMTIILVSTLFLGVAIALYFVQNGYNNINTIIKAIRGFEHDTTLNGYKSEWDLINNTIVSYISKNESLQKKIYEQIPIMKNTFFSRLLKSSFTDEQSVDEMLEFLSLNIKKDRYGVFILDVDSSNNVNSSEKNEPIREVVQATLINIVENLVDKDCFVYALQDEAYRISVIIGVDDRSNNHSLGNDSSLNDISYDSRLDKRRLDNSIPNNISNISNISNTSNTNNISNRGLNNFEHDNYVYLVNIARKIKDVVKNDLGFTVTIGIGGLYNKLWLLSDSYNEACEALEYKIIMGRDAVISYDAICSRGTRKVCYSFKQEKELINFLKMGEYEEIQKILDEIVHTIKSEPVTIDFIKYIYFDIINTAMKAADEINIKSSNIEIFINNLNNMGTLDEIYSAVSNFYLKLCDEVKDAKMSKNLELRDKVIEYINKNYSDSMLSVEGIADYFSVSPSYLSRFMKDHIGYSITDYIHQVRLQKAKELLQNTEKTVAVIAEEVGYNSLHNFSRVFKRYESITPTNFRTIGNL